MVTSQEQGGTCDFSEKSSLLRRHLGRDLKERRGRFIERETREGRRVKRRAQIILVMLYLRQVVFLSSLGSKASFI